MSDDTAGSAARAWLERFQGFAPADPVVREIADTSERFAAAAREASENLSFDSDAHQFAGLLRDLAPDKLKK